MRSNFVKLLPESTCWRAILSPDTGGDCCRVTIDDEHGNAMNESVNNKLTSTAGIEEYECNCDFIID